METRTTDLIEMAAAEGRHSRDAYWEEFEVLPEDEPDPNLGDWDSAAWSIAWHDLVNAGATEADHDACREAWQKTFWDWES